MSFRDILLNRKRIEACVESLCHKGCKAVWGCIATLESGSELPETRSLTRSERAAVLDELKSIMSVYAGTCSAS